MTHDHLGHHSADVNVSMARLFITMCLNFVITAVEVVGGILSGSLSLLSDALHNFSDGIAIIITYIAIRLGKAPKTAKYTFGLKRAEIIAAVLNAGTLIVICFYLFKESYDRFVSPLKITGSLMIIVASVGLVANLIGTWLLKKGSRDNINIRSAYIHLLGDAISSMAVVIGGVCITFFKIYWLDPLLTVLISIYILYESIDIVKIAINVLMMGTPEHVDIEIIQKEVEKIPGVKNIHHVHIWRLNEQMIHFEAHVDVEDMLLSQTTALSNRIEEELIYHHGIHHVTLQFEADKCVCKELVNDR